MATLKNYVIDEMIDKIAEMEDTSHYGADLGYEIFESSNIDGSYTYSAQESKDWIREHFDELGEVVEDIKFNLGAEFIPNPFTETEKFQVVIMLEMSSALCAQVDFIDENWNNVIDLTEDNIKLIINKLMELKD